MKFLKLSIPMFALVMGLTLSASTTASNILIVKQAKLNWYIYDAATNQLTAFLGFIFRSSAVSASCPDLFTVVCAIGYTSPQPLHVTPPAAGQDYIRKF